MKISTEVESSSSNTWESTEVAVWPALPSGRIAFDRDIRGGDSKVDSDEVLVRLDPEGCRESMEYVD